MIRGGSITTTTVAKPLQPSIGYSHLLNELANVQNNSIAQNSTDAPHQQDSEIIFNENALPAFLRNNQGLSSASDDFKVKDPTVLLDDWIKQEDAKVVTVTVADPHLVPSKASRRRSSTSSFQALFSKNKAVYVVTIEGFHMTKHNDVRFVERTFADFALLREVLLRRFPGCCPPPLPASKSKIGTSSEQFVQKRSRLLTLFLQTVGDHPFFRNDQVFELFVASPVPFNDSLGRFNGVRSEGTERWRQAMRAASLPRNPSLLIEILKSELRAVEGKLDRLKQAAKLEVEKSIARANSSQEMVKAFDSWLAVERETSSPLAGAAQVDVRNGESQFTANASLPDALAPLSIKYANYATTLLHEYGEAQMETSVLDLTRFELRIITVWLQALDEALQAERKVQKLQGTVKQLTESNKPVPISTKHDLDVAKGEQAKFHRGLLGVELVRLKQSRIARALRLNFSLTNMHLDGAEAISAVWRSTAGASTTMTLQRTNDMSMVSLIVDESAPDAIIQADAKPSEPPLPEAKEESAPKPVEAPPPVVAPAPPQVIVQEVLSEEKIKELAFSVASKAVEETRAKAQEEEAARRKKEQEETAKLRLAEAHKYCRSISEVADMFWNAVYCLIAVHVFFVLVFLSRGFLKEAVPIVVLAALTFVAGFLVEIVYR